MHSTFPVPRHFRSPDYAEFASCPKGMPQTGRQGLFREETTAACLIAPASLD
jgi:hypothetical protein